MLFDDTAGVVTTGLMRPPWSLSPTKTHRRDWRRTVRLLDSSIRTTGPWCLRVGAETRTPENTTVILVAQVGVDPIATAR